MTSVGEVFHQFERHGVRSVVLPAELHLAIYAWPECGTPTLSVDVRKHAADDAAKSERLFAAVQTPHRPGQVRTPRIERGSDVW